jgi:hypothetical protein
MKRLEKRKALTLTKETLRGLEAARGMANPGPATADDSCRSYCHGRCLCSATSGEPTVCTG